MRPAAARFEYLDGLRGIAALQVVFLHYASAFVPAMAIAFASPPATARPWQVAFGQSPLFAGMDGYVAVDIFFLLSGLVLRGAFGRLGGVAAGVWRRLIRLGLPAASASLIAVGLLALDPSSHHLAALRSGSQPWLGSLITQPASLPRLLREALLNSMLLGYQEVAVLRRWLVLPSLTDSFNPPIWTLNIEFFGSLLCLLLSFLYRAHRGAASFLAVCIALILPLASLALPLFVIGFWLAGAAPRRPAAWRPAFGWVCLAAGLLLCRTIAVAPVAWLLGRLHVASAPTLFSLNNELAALLLLLAVLNLPALQALLTTRPAQYLGRISFSLYLLHFPIMATLGCRVFLLATPYMGLAGGALAALAVGLPVTLAAAEAFTRLVDQPAVRCSGARPNLHLAAPAS